MEGRGRLQQRAKLAWCCVGRQSGGWAQGDCDAADAFGVLTREMIAICSGCDAMQQPGYRWGGGGALALASRAGMRAHVRAARFGRCVLPSAACTCLLLCERSLCLRCLLINTPIAISLAHPLELLMLSQVLTETLQA